MLSAEEQMIQALAFVVQMTPIGTNLGLLRMMWVMVNGSFLRSRGGIFPALNLNGLSPKEVCRTWAALGYGSWTIGELLSEWQVYVASQNEWQANRYAGLQVLSIDITGFWRPRLKGWLGKHYSSVAGRALPAVALGVMTLSGRIQEKRIPLLQAIKRCKPESSESDFRVELLKAAEKRGQSASEVKVLDAGFYLAEIHMAKLKQYVVRLASNCTACRNQLPDYQGRGRRPEYGETVRPLARTRKEKTIAATTPDQTSQFDYQGRRIQVSSWFGVVTSQTKVNDQAPTYSIHLLDDPAYTDPLILATDLLHISPEQTYLIYKDRWPVEHPPLAAKQMIGLHRQFVFAKEAVFRLPELALLVGNVLTYVAGLLPAIPTGFWDRQPSSTPGRLRRYLEQVDFPNLDQIHPDIRKKNSVSAHLPKGVHAHRRQKPAA